MVSASPGHDRADGPAVFAAAAFLLGVGLIAALERVGAPDGFVQALGPLLAFLGLSVIGVLTRAPSLLDFLAARRSAPPFYGGLAFAATAAGLALAMASTSGGGAPLPWRGVGVGLVGSAVVVAPALRGVKASALADLLATSFPQPPTRIAFAIILCTVGLLTAVAGFDLAVNALVVAIGSNRRIAQALVMLALALSIVPGGFKGLLWSDAACGGGALLIIAIGAGLAALNGHAPLAPLTAAVGSAWAEPTIGGASSIWGEIAAAAAIAGFFALAPPAIGAGGVRQARRAGLLGLAFLGTGLALVGVALPYFYTLPGGPSPTAAGLIGAVTWMPALGLARAGVLGTTRAGGFDLATVYSQLGVLASRRIAMNRLGMLATIVLCPWAAVLPLLDPGHTLFLALAIGLAFVTPSLLLTLTPRASEHGAMTALSVGVIVAAMRFVFVGSAGQGPNLLIDALIVGGISLAAGTASTFVFPRKDGRTRRPINDCFIDIPLDGVD